jgi:hypothetical protein
MYGFVTTDIDTLASALHVRTDDLLRGRNLGRRRGAGGMRPLAGDREALRAGRVDAVRLFKPLHQTIESINAPQPE